MTAIILPAAPINPEPLFVQDAFMIPELAFWLGTYCTDNDVEPRALDLETVKLEAEYVLGLFADSGTVSSEMLRGLHGPEDKLEAERNVYLIKTFLELIQKGAYK
jgi:hypothetical protein